MKRLRKYIKYWLISHPKFNPYVLVKIGIGRIVSHPFRMLPDFIIIGSEKCGTTSLYDYMIKHPLIISAKTKEIHYFDINYLGLWWYRSHFPTIFQKIFKKSCITGEATPYYLYHPLVAKRILMDIPKVKLIVILRDPVSRAYSQYHDNLKKNQEVLSFENAIRNENIRIIGEKEKIIKNSNYHSESYWLFSYISKGIYVNQLKDWLKFFDRDKILILDSFDLQSNPQEVLNRVYSFLGISAYSSMVKNKKNVGKYKEMNLETRKNLEEFYKPYNIELEKLLGKKFSWM
jgi:hypothetical protein